MKTGLFLFVSVFLMFLQCSENKISDTEKTTQKNFPAEKVTQKDFPNVAIFEYSSKEHYLVFREGKPTMLSDDEIAESLEILKKLLTHIIKMLRKIEKSKRLILTIYSFYLFLMPKMKKKYG